jgi:hypothetical protein
VDVVPARVPQASCPVEDGKEKEKQRQEAEKEREKQQEEEKEREKKQQEKRSAGRRESKCIPSPGRLSLDNSSSPKESASRTNMTTAPRRWRSTG